MPKVTILSGHGTGHEYPISEEAVLGRQSDNAVPLQDTKVSRHHTRIFYKDGLYYIEDLGSRNGTLVNGESVKMQTIASEDRIQIGETLLLFTHDKPLSKDDAQDEEDSSTSPPEGKMLTLEEISIAVTTKAPEKRKTSFSPEKTRKQRNCLPPASSFSNAVYKMLVTFVMLLFLGSIMLVAKWLTLKILS
jgi:predicted component of type VI protein secretion system